MLAGYEGLAEHLLLVLLLLLLLHAEQQMVLHLPYTRITSEFRVLPANLASQLGHTNSMPMLGSLCCEDYCEVSLFFSRFTFPPIELPILFKNILLKRAPQQKNASHKASQGRRSGKARVGTGIVGGQRQEGQ